jgi:hypothetical protein
MPSGPTPEKPSVYYALLEALLKQGCPVCRMMQQASLGYLDSLFYEQVTDVGVRRKLRRARGLCPAHAWKAREMTTAALGIAIIAKDLLDEECTRLTALQPRTLWRRLSHLAQTLIPRQALRIYLRGWRRRDVCPVCQAAAAHERHALETVLIFLDDGELAGRFEASSGLCVPHVVRALELNPTHPGVPSLVQTQRRLYGRLLAELEEFCRKHDYRFTGESWGPESNAWQRAIESLAGKPGMFGEPPRRREGRRPGYLQTLFGWWR